MMAGAVAVWQQKEPVCLADGGVAVDKHERGTASEGEEKTWGTVVH